MVASDVPSSWVSATAIFGKFQEGIIYMYRFWTMMSGPRRQNYLDI